MNIASKRVKIWRMADLHDAEMLKGAYTKHSYPWHSHDELCLGIVVAGAIRLQTRKEESIAKSGSFVLINSDEIHQGLPPTPEGWHCRTLHIAPEAVNAIAMDVTGRGSIRAPLFRGPTLEDPALTQAFLKLHQGAEASISSLEQQSHLVSIISRLVRHHTLSPSLEVVAGSEPESVSRAKAYLDEYMSDKVTLCELSLAAQLPPFRLLRAFKRAVGISPHVYQSQARVREAHRRLKLGEAISDVSVAVGFADQAHLTRIYKSIMGGTPGQFRSAGLAA